MAFDREQREALHVLQSIENGSVSTAEAARLVEDADPALVYLILTWLRKRYRGDHPAAEGVIGRLVELSERYESVGERMREGKSDPVVSWFEDEHTYRELDATEFIAVVVEKLES